MIIADWLRGGRTKDEIRRGKYGLGMAFAALDRRNQNRILKDMKARGCTHMVFERCLGPYPLWDWTTTKVCKPNEIADACKIIRDAGLLPMVGPLFSQKEVKDKTLDQLTQMAERHNEKWGCLSDWAEADVVWVAFEVNESVPFGGTKEGMRGDDWVTALLGRMQEVFDNTDIAVHMTANERHYYTRFESNVGTSNENPPTHPILLYQFPWDWTPDLDNGTVEYKNDDGTVSTMRASEAYALDWGITLRRCEEESPRQIVLPWEWSSKDPKHSDAKMRDVAMFLNGISRALNLPEGQGMGTWK